MSAFDTVAGFLGFKRSDKVQNNNQVQNNDNVQKNNFNNQASINTYSSSDEVNFEASANSADLSLSSIGNIGNNKISGAKEKALTAQKAFQDAPSGSANEFKLQKEFINAYIDWAKTVLDDKNASKNDVNEVISKINGLKQYNNTEIKKLQTTLNSYLPKLQAKTSSVSQNEKPKAQAVTTPSKTNTAPKEGIATTYKIQPDDTFYKLAIRYGVTVDDLKMANPDVNETKLKVGQEINIPQKPKAAPKEHVVQKGEYLSVLASKYGVSVKEIVEANPQIKNPDSVPIGTKLTIPEPKPQVINSNMPVDASKKAEYKAAIADMIKAKGVTDKAEIEKLSNLITEKAIEMKVDPVLIAGIVGQEVDFRYMSDNIWGKNGKGMTQLTYSTIEDLYRLKGANDNNVPSYYRGCKDKLAEIFAKYPTADELYDAICKKENYELNLEVGIAIFKGKMEIDYSTHPERSEQEHIEYAVRNYNGNTEKRASGIEIRDEYRNKIIANYNSHKVA